jgi:serine/threonine-protein kinase HipA
MVLRDYGATGALRALLQRVAFNAAIGNADAHAKNFSFLHPADTISIRLAPIYDVLSTISLEERTDVTGTMMGASTRMGQRINGRENIMEVSKADIVSEGTLWGMRRKDSEDYVDEVLDALSQSISKVDESPSVLNSISLQLARVTDS